MRFMLMGSIKCISCIYEMTASFIQLGHTHMLQKRVQNWIVAWQWIYRIVWMQSVPCAALLRMKFLDSMDSVDVGRMQICLQIVFDIHRKNLLQGFAD